MPSEQKKHHALLVVKFVCERPIGTRMPRAKCKHLVMHVSSKEPPVYTCKNFGRYHDGGATSRHTGTREGKVE